MDIHLINIFISLSLIMNIYCSELIGGHYDHFDATNQRNSSHQKHNITENQPPAEDIPDPSALITTGYNLPGHLFNNGKPFYVGKDPLTGAIDFNNQKPAGKQYSTSEYDYIDEEPSSDIYEKANIDRKDGGFGSHRPNDVNQLSPNFHDFLNLPVKYNSEKYVYPLISNSYANTKIQGNVKNYNHKQYSASSTYKTTVSPLYYTAKTSTYHYNSAKVSTTDRTTLRTTTTPPLTTTKAPAIYFTTKAPTTKNDNLLNSPMNHPSYITTAETDYDYDYYTTQMPIENKNQELYITTEPPRKNIFIIPKVQVTTTKKPYSIFDELFGDYEDPEPVAPQMTPPSVYTNLPTSISENKYYDSYNKMTAPPAYTQTITSKPFLTYPTTKQPDNTKFIETVSQIYPANEESNYEYEDEEYNNNYNEETVHMQTNKNYTSFVVSTNNQTKHEHVTETNILVQNKTVTKNESFHENITNNTQIYSDFQPSYENIHYPVKHQQHNLQSQNTSQHIRPDIQSNYTVPSTTEKQENNYISITSQKYDYYDSEEYNPPTTSKPPGKIHSITDNFKVTSMPLGENHPPNTKLPIIKLAQNLKDSLNREKVELTTKSFVNAVSFEKSDINAFPDRKPTLIHQIPSTSNIHIAPDQDVVSFVVGNHQSVDGGHYIGSAVKEEPYVSNSFRPLYTHQNSAPVMNQFTYNRPMVQDTVKYAPPAKHNISTYHEASSLLNVEPLRGAEASLSVGLPVAVDEVNIVSGQLAHEHLNENEGIEYPKGSGSKIVFPEEHQASQNSQSLQNSQSMQNSQFQQNSQSLQNAQSLHNLQSIQNSQSLQNSQSAQNAQLLHNSLRDREILSLYSKPMFHQLPADLTPPSEPEVKPLRSGSPRPPWDPRPGHFYQGRPEFSRPPRPAHKPEIYKRIDGLPNILPQFRPNAKVSNGHYMDSVGTINAGSGYMPRQPLLDRPSNRPIGFFEKLHPPPPPKRIHEQRKVTSLEPEAKHDRYRFEERVMNVPSSKLPQDHYNIFQAPPKVAVSNRNSDDEMDIATLQMIQSKQTDKLDTIRPNVPPPFKITYETTEKPLYVVYPVNSAPLKLDVIDNESRETVVVGTRGEQLPLPPSKINQEIGDFEQKAILKPKDRNDAPILKPHARPNNIYPMKFDFPYILERPDPTLMNLPLLSSSTDFNILNNVDTTVSTTDYKNSKFNEYQPNNQWTSIDVESRIVNGNKINHINDQISATLKMHTEKPIAIAYTPTEPTDKYSIPNFGRPMITEIRNPHHPGIVSNNDSEFTVSAVMHTHPQIKLNNQNEIKYYITEQKTSPQYTSTRRPPENIENHKLNLDVDTTHVPAKLDFQAPFHASVSVNSEYQGWSVVNNNHNSNSKIEIDRSDTDVSATNVPESSSEFDIENFKPQLFSGFKPIYNGAADKEKNSSNAGSERQE